MQRSDCVSHSQGLIENAETHLGAICRDDGHCLFRVWAPLAEQVEVRLLPPAGRLVPLTRDERGYHSALIEAVEPGSRYLFRLDDAKERPDPASHFQPEGVHGPSQVVDHRFAWEDERWIGLPLREYIVYELHVGTFTPEGTFEAVIPRLGALKDLGVNAIELMPVSQFPGDRNWGYDGVYPFAVHNSYGGPQGLKRLVTECHKQNMAVILDVVYNHLGPEGNYLRDFGPYFTGKYRTPWGEAINFDDAHSDEVRQYFIQNAIFWLQHYHIDALRLDAVHAIYDSSAVPFLQELAERVEAFWMQQGIQRHLIAESDLNDARLIRPRDAWGCGLDAQWSDDFHHALHTLLTGEDQGYYADFGELEHLVKAVREGFVYSGQHSVYRKRRHGNSPLDRPMEQFMVASQNHDQVGNRMLGERLSTLISFESLKLAAAATILSPFLPLLFMGEEYGEEAPFLYFVSHTDPDLIAAVRAGRREEFRHFSWQGEPPDPESIETYLHCKLNWQQRLEGKHKILRDFYKALIALRQNNPAFSTLERDHLDALGLEGKKVMSVRRWWGESEVLCLFNFNSEDMTIHLSEIQAEGIWQKMLDSAYKAWGGPGTLLPEELLPKEPVAIKAQSAAVYARTTGI